MVATSLDLHYIKGRFEMICGEERKFLAELKSFREKG